MLQSRKQALNAREIGLLSEYGLYDSTSVQREYEHDTIPKNQLSTHLTVRRPFLQKSVASCLCNHHHDGRNGSPVLTRTKNSP